MPLMYASLLSGPVAALPAPVPSSTRGSCGSGGGGGGRGCVPREGKRPGGPRASGRGASVRQVSEEAGFASPAGLSFLGVSPPPPRAAGVLVPAPARAPSKASGWPPAAQGRRSQAAGAGLVPAAFRTPPGPGSFALRAFPSRWVGGSPACVGCFLFFLISTFLQSF